MNEKQPLLDEDKTTSDDNTNEKKKQIPIRKESSIGLRQLVSVLSIDVLILVLYKFSFGMLVELII